MSAESSKSNPPLQALLPINFLIIGGGIAGLACALALRRVGHRVTVLERTDKVTARGDGGVRLPPNLTKILFHWGLKDILMKKASITKRLIFMRYETGERLGEHVWDEEMLKETRGVFMMLTHSELYDILYDAATGLGAQVRYNANAVELDPAEELVRLDTGEELSADVLIGADGGFGVCRAAILGNGVRGKGTGLAVYDTIVPSSSLPEYAEEIREWHGQFVAFGNRHAIVAYPIHGIEDIAFQFYAPDNEHEGKYGSNPTVDVLSVVDGISPQLAVVAKVARKAVRVSIQEHPDLEDWVHPHGRLVIIGEAAHPFPPSTIQGTAMAIEDGAVLAKLFSHLSEERQIESFLYAFQELRQERADTVRHGEFASVMYMTADGELATTRDENMRRKAAAGRNVLDGEGDCDAASKWEEYRVIFGYDCEDEADDWWVQWGMLRERALDRESIHASSVPSLLDLYPMMSSVQVTSTDGE
ncbi:FAD/NAD(P)-binding domain-containing protein [Dichomitus squalens LYAD-421 SS1]|uniref:FAD/NAD(P)-binding domain-containing protein n=1 Tax=Dichomitus squalens (strain LYAD-421) TaxID=732165 RepID=R7SMK6_DICSQ|nr:FAD/NAD(P)-binding domain-containing protein [Dichomitus squalens LYAD-421 SS1]EJF57123.1 FAD/NAD(P)-binding domain-containing protein [Dichomitus squalens LYAD-421 SS1]